MEPASRLLAEDVPGFDKAGRGSEFVDKNLEHQQEGTGLGVPDLSRIPDSTTSLLRWTSPLRIRPAAEGRPDAWHARK